MNAKLYIPKESQYHEQISSLLFTGNVADYGGAIFVADETNSATCASVSYKSPTTITECFLLALSLHRQPTHTVVDVNFTV